MIKKYMIITIVSVVAIGMAAAVSAEEELIRPGTDVTSIEEGETGDEEPLVIAPNPDTTIEHNAEDGERGIDILPENQDVIEENTENDLVIAPNAKELQEKSDEVAKAGMPIVGIIGVAAFLVLALVIINKKK